MFHKLLTRQVPALEVLKDYGESLARQRRTRSCFVVRHRSHRLTHRPKFTKVAFGKGHEVCFTGYVCRGHELIIDEALAKSKSDLIRINGIMSTCYYPLTRAELSGDFH